MVLNCIDNSSRVEVVYLEDSGISMINMGTALTIRRTWVVVSMA